VFNNYWEKCVQISILYSRFQRKIYYRKYWSSYVITMPIENLIRRDTFRLKLAENSPAKYLCFSLGTPCRGVRAKKETGRGGGLSPFEIHARAPFWARVVPRQSAAHTAFGTNILRRMYWILPPYASYLLSTAHDTDRLFSARYFTRVTWKGTNKMLQKVTGINAYTKIYNKR